MKSKTIKVNKEWYDVMKLAVRAFNMSMGEISRTALKYAHNNSSHVKKINSDYKGDIVFKFKYKSLYGFSNDEIRSLIIQRVLQHDLNPIKPVRPEYTENIDYLVESVNG